jgi:hypothetical protein
MLVREACSYVNPIRRTGEITGQRQSTGAIPLNTERIQPLPLPRGHSAAPEANQGKCPRKATTDEPLPVAVRMLNNDFFSVKKAAFSFQTADKLYL